MNEQELKHRTKDFGLRVLKVIDALPETRSGRVLAAQLSRSGTSVGANYRAACRSRSTAEMVSKLAVVEEEADESGHWLEMIIDHGLMPAETLEPLRAEADELTAIMVASRRTLQARNPKSRIENRKSSQC
jgi:four helix bundle protein